MSENLLDKLGSKSKANQTTDATKIIKDQDEIGDIINKEQGHLRRGEDFIEKAKKSSEAVASQKEAIDEEPKQSEKVEPSSDSLVKDPDSWTLESAFKEIKKLREENKQQRILREQELAAIKSEVELKLKEKEKELEEYRKAKKELDMLREKEADKKRSLEEKLADREAKLTELEIALNNIKQSYEQKLAEQKEILARYESEIKAQEEVYKQRLNSELQSIPEKFRQYAELIVEGAKAKGDYRDALIALSEAKLRGIFEDKTVVVNHSVPGAHDGARLTPEKAEEVRRAELDKMSPSQKIAEAIKQIRKGIPNSAYKS